MRFSDPQNRVGISVSVAEDWIKKNVNFEAHSGLGLKLLDKHKTNDSDKETRHAACVVPSKKTRQIQDTLL